MSRAYFRGSDIPDNSVNVIKPQLTLSAGDETQEVDLPKCYCQNLSERYAPTSELDSAENLYRKVKYSHYLKTTERFSSVANIGNQLNQLFNSNIGLFNSPIRYPTNAANELPSNYSSFPDIASILNTKEVESLDVFLSFYNLPMVESIRNKKLSILTFSGLDQQTIIDVNAFYGMPIDNPPADILNFIGIKFKNIIQSHLQETRFKNSFASKLTEQINYPRNDQGLVLPNNQRFITLENFINTENND
ncbi:hypothetical protein DASC09_001650 [Saccharomycopsis crataegensis]|uniref:Uncharacterized protein n=1 Tax=Saccharomycopsis crataegensis TaxID=43959 RepID=A0AAV5QEJ1_9ASCO|nr:hypothetical protein DASC09_001650 [Saccharomycopsis crataegensis]